VGSFNIFLSFDYNLHFLGIIYICGRSILELALDIIYIALMTDRNTSFINNFSTLNLRGSKILVNSKRYNITHSRREDRQDRCIFINIDRNLDLDYMKNIVDRVTQI